MKNLSRILLCCIFSLSGFYFAIGQDTEPCPECQDLTDIVPSGTYEASDCIRCDGFIEQGSVVAFTGGIKVELNEGFDLSLGGELDVYIQGCDAPLQDTVLEMRLVGRNVITGYDKTSSVVFLHAEITDEAFYCFAQPEHGQKVLLPVKPPTIVHDNYTLKLPEGYPLKTDDLILVESKNGDLLGFWLIE